MFKFLRNSKYTMIVSLSALVISLASVGFGVADAYASRTTVLAQALQSVGLCPVPSVVQANPTPTVTVTASPKASASPTPSGSKSPTPKVTVSADPSASPIKGATGTNGSKGATGSSGSAGTSGSDGATGATGATGEKGDTGAAGSTGATGATGPQGPAGICDLSNILSVNGDLIPAIDNTYSLGTLEKRWKSLQLGPGTLWIQDSEVTPPTQVGLTVKSGALLLDGADSLRIGNIRLTSTGLTSMNATGPITLGDGTFNGLVQLQSGGLAFGDGSVQTKAWTGGVGAQGDKGDKGDKGETGAKGDKGDPGAAISGYHDQVLCVKNGGGLEFGACTSQNPNDHSMTVLVKD
ncbi:MAG: hypothetical protein RL723_1217 [Actinomycetota bacterium]